MGIDKPRRGFSIHVFLPDGTADGLRLVEKSNWIGRAIVCPRALYAEAKARLEFSKTGVYVLTGPTADVGFPMIYVGEGDPVKPRIDQHYAKKDFWTSLVLFTSKDDNLNKAHVQYLEARLTALAKEANRCQLDNANLPQLPSLSEADVADMESFLDEMLLIYPLLGLSIFEKPQSTQGLGAQLLWTKAKGLQARGYESPQGFVVLAGSEACKDAVPSIHKYMADLRDSLREKNILADQGDRLRLTQDYVFDSPSTAAGVMLGRTANGRIEWKDADGRTLKEIQAEAAETE
jgi:hypothetical protein